MRGAGTTPADFMAMVQQHTMMAGMYKQFGSNPMMQSMLNDKSAEKQLSGQQGGGGSITQQMQ